MPGRRSPVCGVFRVALGEPGLLADRLEPEDACEESRGCEDKRRAVERQSKEEDEEPAVDGMTCAGVDARGSKCRAITWSRQRSERPTEGYAAHNQNSRAGGFKREPDDSEPGLTVVGPGRADDGTRDRGDNDDRLKDDPAFTASSQSRGIHRPMVRLLRCDGMKMVSFVSGRSSSRHPGSCLRCRPCRPRGPGRRARPSSARCMS
jgi:hypothetical protein